MTQQHPITPPPELVKQWVDQSRLAVDCYQSITTRAARWGAEQMWEACYLEIIDGIGMMHIVSIENRLKLVDDLNRAICPKPPSLKEQALKKLAWIDEHLNMPLHNHCDAVYTIRRALEQLPDD